MALLDQFRGPATSLDDQIESFSTERVPGHARWPIPAISLVLLGNATAMFFFSFGAQQTFLVGWPMMLLPDRLLLLRRGPDRHADHAHGLPRRTVAEPAQPRAGLRQPRRRGHLVHLRGELHLLLPLRGHDRLPRRSRSTSTSRSTPSAASPSSPPSACSPSRFVWRGMHAMSKLQSWGFPIFLVLLAWGLIQLATHTTTRSALPAGTPPAR